MNVPRADHACTEVKDEDGKIVQVMVAGGVEDVNAPSPLETIEVYDVENKHWEMGPNLLYPTLGSSLVPSHKSSAAFIYLLGGCQYYKNGKRRGNCSEVYTLSEGNNHWNIIGNLKQSRINHIAVLNPPDF